MSGFDLYVDGDGGLYVEVYGADGSVWIDPVTVEPAGLPVVRDDFEADHGPLTRIGRAA